MAAGGDVGRFGPLLLDIIHDIGGITGFRDNINKKDCIDLGRRISLLCHLFEDFSFLSFSHSSSAGAGAGAGGGSSSSTLCSSLRELLSVLKVSKKLLLSQSANVIDDGSKKIGFEIQSVTWHLERVLGKLPYSDFRVSEEVQEQIELVRAQLRRAVKRYGSLSSKELSETLHNDGRRITSSFQIEESGDNNQDIRATVEIVPSSHSQKGDTKAQILQNLDPMGNLSSSLTLREIDTNKDVNLASRSSGEAKMTDSIAIPDEYRCPISLELMKDPVIVATGQTYERSCIQRWIDCGNKTCPKTQQVLIDLTMTPNYVLRSLIMRFCENNKIDLPMGLVNGRIRRSDGSFHKVTGDMACINSLVHKLSSRSIGDRRSAAIEIRSLSKRSTDNRILIAEAGAIPVLVMLLTSEDVITQENAVTAILNLSIFENNKGLIMFAGAISSIVQVLRMGSMVSRENAAATLFSLSLLDENKITIGASGAIQALVELLQNGSARGKKDALTALFNLCIYQGNKGRAVRAGILVPLMNMLTDSSSSMVDESLTILSLIASHQEGKAAIVKANSIPILIDLIRAGPPRNKENAASILLLLCKKDAENLACIGRLGAVIPLSELTKSGTERAKRKATSLLEHLRKLQKL
ncbi:hypothetical protein GIB67_025658 [Kingdonia uniflora]|uniref:U-box domain-containing protein 12 n=1 Tax=Kingdonia uniflora TaxID=39325 RepID=A0A7J7L8N5_9MAGN|nr:hypothetical protein GIB67_025658 [Kingdonia uniflora]